MYDINIKEIKDGKKLFFIFFVAGIIFLIIIGSMFINSFLTLKNLDSTTESIKVEIESHKDNDGTTMYSPVYYYLVNEEEYICHSDSSSNVNPGTDNKTVYYDSKEPSKCMTQYSKSSNYILLGAMIIPLIFIIFPIIEVTKINKQVKMVKKLNKNGKLVKNLPYYLEESKMGENDIEIQRPIIDYTLQSGSIIKLYGDRGSAADAKETMDLVIDEKNPNNYYIYREINRLTGNLPTDYYDNQQSYNTYQSNNQYQNIQIDKSENINEHSNYY